WSCQTQSAIARRVALCRQSTQPHYPQLNFGVVSNVQSLVCETLTETSWTSTATRIARRISNDFPSLESKPSATRCCGNALRQLALSQAIGVDPTGGCIGCVNSGCASLLALCIMAVDHETPT